MKVLILVAVVLQFSAIACHTQSNGANGIGSSPESAPFRSIHLPAGTHPDGLSIADANNDDAQTIGMRTGRQMNRTKWRRFRAGSNSICSIRLSVTGDCRK